MNDIWPHWSKPLRVEETFDRIGRKKITPQESGDIRFTGMYAFSTDDGPLTRENVLYIGIATGGKHSIRQRLGSYLRGMRDRRAKIKGHAGKYMLVQHWMNGDQRIGAAPSTGGHHPIWVRWTKCADPVNWEGYLIEKFDPPYNTKNETNFLSDEE